MRIKRRGILTNASSLLWDTATITSFGATYKTKTRSYEYKCNSLSMDKLLVSLKSTKY